MAAHESTRELIAERFRLARERAGLSQGQAAKLMDIHRPTISEIEAGRRRVVAEELARFAELFGVNVAWLVGTRGDDPDLTDPRLALVARELKKLKSSDIDLVMQFIAAVQHNEEE
jgi:transcriptional regulator with XRE-family HTH domain